MLVASTKQKVEIIIKKVSVLKEPSHHLENHHIFIYLIEEEN